MALLQFKNPKFIKSAFQPKGWPLLKNDAGLILPEIAVAGRSNVGKSTLLNHLFQKKGFVKTSATPGKTQSLNFFTVDDQVAFVDLPGYGYASVPIEVRQKWGPMIERYLREREHLRILLFLFDIRRLPQEEDLQLLDWILYNDLPMILVLTKCDKVTANEQKTNTKKILEKFGLTEVELVHYSSTKNKGRRELIGKLTEAIFSGQDI